MKNLFTLLAITLLTAQLAKAHGEDKPGPHGGYIKMPANFHTELVPAADGSFMIYLIDIQFQNPVIENSKVKVFFNSGKKKITLNCTPMKDHFHCFSKQPIKKGILSVRATRSGNSATMDAKYDLPLKSSEPVKTQTTKPESVDHSAHH